MRWRDTSGYIPFVVATCFVLVSFLPKEEPTTPGMVALRCVYGVALVGMLVVAIRRGRRTVLILDDAGIALPDQGVALAWDAITGYRRRFVGRIILLAGDHEHPVTGSDHRDRGDIQEFEEAMAKRGKTKV